MTDLHYSLPTRVIVRILDRAGEVVGAGFLVGPDRVATCAHVIAEAVGGDAFAPEAPLEPVRLEFPLLEAEPTPLVTGAVERWVPIGPDGSGDIALLRISGALPDGARMPPLRRVERLWDRGFRVLGFPEGLADGVWTTGVFRGAQGTRWFQLQSTAGEQPIVGGFSGAPVWDDDSGAVVGMTVAADASGATTTAYLIPIDQVLGIDPDLLPCPYRGLEPFGEEHAAYFFGRETDIDRLLDVVTRHPLVAVTGPSGVGKSSLLRAGLLPRLRAAGARIAELRPTADDAPAAALAAVLGPAPAKTLSAEPTVLFVDQFEELAGAAPLVARELLARLGDLVSSAPRRPDGSWSVRVVLTLRSATLDDVAAREVADLLGAGTVLLPSMDRGQLRDAIVAPAERAPGLSFEPGLVDRILDDAAAEPGRLPLVESLLTELWEHREGGHLTLAAYERAGGVAGVVATHAERVVSRFTDPAAEPRLRRFLTGLAAPDRDGHFVRSPMALADIPADVRDLVEPLAAGRLVVVERASTGVERVQLAHQALIAHWPRLRDWLVEDREFLGWRTQLDQQRERWERNGHDDGSLLRGTALAAAQQWLPERTSDVSSAGQAYVRQSVARQRREVRRWRVVTAVLAVLVLAAGVLAAVTVANRNEIGERLRLANAELTAQAALARVTSDPVAATQLALVASRLDPANPSARTALLRQVAAMRSVVAVYPEVTSSPITNLASNDDLSRIVLLDGAGLVVVSGIPIGEPDRWVVPGVPSDRTDVRMDPRGILYVADKSGAMWRWDTIARTGPVRMPFDVSGLDPGTTALGPGRDTLMWLTSDAPGVHRLQIRNLVTGAAVPHGVGPIAVTGDVGVNAGDDRDKVVVKTGAAGSTVITVRSLVDGAELRTFPPGSARVAGGVLSCEPYEGDRTIGVLRNLDGVEVSRTPPLTVACSASRPLLPTNDGLHLIQYQFAQDKTDVNAVLITRLADGHRFELALPPDADRSVAPQLPPALSVLPGGDSSITVLAGRSSSILRLRGLPAPAGAAVNRPLTATRDGSYLVSADDDGYAVFDPQFRELARRSAAEAGTAGKGGSLIADALFIESRTPAGWVVAEFALPSLTRSWIHAFPASPDATRANVITSDDRVVTALDGTVTVLDRRTGQPLFPPTELAATASEKGVYRTLAEVEPRPEHSDEVAVRAPGLGIELWNVATRQRIGTVPMNGRVGVYGFAFSPSGDRLAVLDVGGQITIWDMATMQPVRPPFPAPGNVQVIGFTADDTVITRGQESPPVLTFWNAGSGRQTGTLSLPKVYFLNTVDEQTQTLSFMAVSSALPTTLPMTARQWFDRLCSISDRPLAAGERAALPSGVDVTNPCR